MRSHTTTLVLLAAFATGVFITANVMFAVLITFGPTYILWIHGFARYWGDLCFIYLFFQFLPLISAYTLSEREFKVDRYTSPIASAVTVGMLLLFTFWVAAGPDGWQVVRYDAYASIFDIVFVVLMWSLRRDARRAAAG